MSSVMSKKAWEHSGHAPGRSSCATRKLRGSKFAQPPDGGVFGSEALPEGWCVTGAATLTRILTRTA